VIAPDSTSSALRASQHPSHGKYYDDSELPEDEYNAKQAAVAASGKRVRKTWRKYADRVIG
jgi:hypothetical protein